MIIKILKGLFILVIFFTLIVTGACGYRLTGTGNQIPEHIKTIAIPGFENKTIRHEAEQFVTFAVKNEFIKRSRLKLIENLDEADAVLEGVINKFEAKPVSFSQDTAHTYRLTIIVSVRFIDLKNDELIFEGNNISFSDTYDVDTGNFFSQETETMGKIADRFANSIVSTILENF